MLGEMEPSFGGAMAEYIIEAFTNRAHETIRKWVLDAVALWAHDGFSRFDDQETSCTARLYHYCDRLRSERRGAYLLFNLEYDAPVLTADMREGRQHPKFARKPDISVVIDQTRIHLEAKLLKPRPLSGLPRQYVEEGMMRFIDGFYPIAVGYEGMMIAYVLEESTPENFEAVNTNISTNLRLGPRNTVTLSERIDDVVDLYVSNHSTCSLLHVGIDLTTRCPSWTTMLAQEVIPHQTDRRKPLGDSAAIDGEHQREAETSLADG